MKDLTKIEETILISIWRLSGDAYGVTIKNQIREMTNRDYLYNTLYTSLEQLVKKGYVKKRFGDPTPTRGGKRKIFFDISEEGFKALKDSFEKQRSVWGGISEDTFEKGIIK